MPSSLEVAWGDDDMEFLLCVWLLIPTASAECKRLLMKCTNKTRKPKSMNNVLSDPLKIFVVLCSQSIVLSEDIVWLDSLLSSGRETRVKEMEVAGNKHQGGGREHVWAATSFCITSRVYALLHNLARHNTALKTMPWENKTNPLSSGIYLYIMHPPKKIVQIEIGLFAPQLTYLQLQYFWRLLVYHAKGSPNKVNKVQS